MWSLRLPAPTVLIVEDEENLLEALKYNLEKESCLVLDGERGLELARETRPDLIILDVMLPKLDGFEVCRILRREANIPMLMLSARGDEVDRVVGVELGADDYVTKPFSMRELLAMVKSMLRRSSMASETDPYPGGELLKAGDIEVDLASHTVRLGGAPIELKPREFDLLALLIANRRRAFTRDQILERLWGHDYIGDARTVDVHIRWLREKIEAVPGSPFDKIQLVAGVLWKLVDGHNCGKPKQLHQGYGVLHVARTPT
jgi:DNA-binding response OmpR family regulator